MKLEDQVCSLDLAKKLKELGVKQESYFTWYQGIGGVWYLGDPAESMNNAVEIGHTTAPQFNFVAAFTVAELGEMLPLNHYTMRNQWEQWTPCNDERALPSESAPTEADTRAKMLIYLLENKLINLN